MSGHKSFKKLGDPIDADPKRRRRIENMKTAQEVLSEQMKDPEFRKEWERIKAVEEAEGGE